MLDEPRDVDISVDAAILENIVLLRESDSSDFTSFPISICVVDSFMFCFDSVFIISSFGGILFSTFFVSFDSRFVILLPLTSRSVFSGDCNRECSSSEDVSE